MKKALTLMLAALTALGFMAGCDDAGCTLYNSTNCQITFYVQSGNVTAVTQYLTVTATGTDQVILNKGVGYSTIQVQLSFDKDVDTLLYEHWTTTTTIHTETDDDGNETTTEVEEDSPHVVDTLFIRKTNFPHFESPDCGTAVFHDIEDSWYRNDSRYPDKGLLDMVYIYHPQVYYNSSDNIRLYINQ
jgi:hypothetical protein